LKNIEELEVYSSFINSFFIWKQKKLTKNYHLSLDVQVKLLDKIILNNRSCDYLRSLGINDIQSFYTNCPAINYDDIESFVLDIKDGKPNNLSRENIIALAMSSGTTSRSKFIPLSKSGINANFNAGKTMLSQYLSHNPASKILEGKNFSLTGSYTKVNGLIVGDVSALFTYFLQPLYKPFRVPNMDVATIADWQEKMDKMIPILAKSDIRWIAGIPSWMSMVIERVEDYTQKDIHNVWKNMEVYFYGGVNVKPFESYFKRKFGDRLNLWQTYNASEGFFGLQMEPNSESLGFLKNTNNFYEFIHYPNIESAAPSILSMEQLKVNETYELVITNTSGLYRYRMGDLLKITSINPVRYEISGRTKNSINVFGEELMVNNTEKAIAELNSEIDFLIKDYTVAPIVTGNSGHHHWQIEFVKEPDCLVHFQNRLDELIRNINSDYDAKRYNNLVLKPLTIELLEKNTMEKWLEANKRISVQAKVPKLWKDRSIQIQISELKNV
jgi:phenylacetate-coenzyme A ligase PaaK-like adenylate-forming protein